jgi:peptide/nickel transport system permease protein
MSFLHLILTRLAASALTLVLVSMVVFGAVQGLPGDAAARILGREASEAAKARLRDEMNLDAPLVQRYATWAGGVLHGDFGTSFAGRTPVADQLLPRLRNTLALSALALLLYVPLSILPALLQARRPDGRLDRALSALTVLVLSTPEFLFATLLLFGFAVWLPWFPPIVQVTSDMGWGAWLHALFLPALTLAILLATYGTRLLRESLIEILQSDHVRQAELKGLSGTRILWRHVLPNALIPWMNATALNIAFLIGGVVVVEKVFGFPGFGSMLVDALQLRDLPVISAGVLVAAAMFVLTNLAADLGALVVNPRLRVKG